MFFSVLSLEHMIVIFFWATKGTFIVASEDRDQNVSYKRDNEGATNKRNSSKGIPVASHY